MFGSLNATVQVDLVETTTHCACRDIEVQSTYDILGDIGDACIGVQHDVLIGVVSGAARAATALCIIQ